MKYKVTWKEFGISCEKSFNSLKESRAFKKFLLKDKSLDPAFVVIWSEDGQVQ